MSESSTSLTGESHSDVTDAFESVLDPTFTSWLRCSVKGMTAPSPMTVYGADCPGIDLAGCSSADGERDAVHSSEQC